jgi:hypothetical protein
MVIEQQAFRGRLKRFTWDSGIKATYPKQPDRVLTKKERRNKVEESEKDRKLFDSLLEMIRAKRKSNGP